jgi:glycerol-3-phosphate dehydrogenase (NAD(P)+)
LARNDVQVSLWGYDREEVARLAARRENQDYLPGVPLPDSIDVGNDLYRLVKDNDQILVVVPSHAFRETISRIGKARADRAGLIVAWGTKGFDPHRGMLLSEVVTELLGTAVSRAVISGPSFANEVAKALPTALTVASDDSNIANRVATWLRNDRVRVYTNEDMAGVQLGGAIKNVMAVAAGISDGLGFGANARAALITRGLAEMNRLGIALGGRPQTFMGLTGVGDLILTCTDNQSRNRRVGIGLGQGKPLQQVLAEIGQEAEGVKTVRELYAMAKSLDVEMPITEQVYQVIYQDLSPQKAVEELFRREPKAE